jgi:hypothetical protein
MHISYALIAAASLLYARRPLVRVLGVLWSPFVLLVVVATGNAFFDAAEAAMTSRTHPLLTGKATLASRSHLAPVSGPSS